MCKCQAYKYMRTVIISQSDVDIILSTMHLVHECNIIYSQKQAKIMEWHCHATLAFYHQNTQNKQSNLDKVE